MQLPPSAGQIAVPHPRAATRPHVEAHAVSDAAGRLHAAGVHTLTIQPPSLDDLFLEQYRVSA